MASAPSRAEAHICIHHRAQWMRAQRLCKRRCARTSRAAAGAFRSPTAWIAERTRSNVVTAARASAARACAAAGERAANTADTHKPHAIHRNIPTSRKSAARRQGGGQPKQSCRSFDSYASASCSPTPRSLRDDGALTMCERTVKRKAHLDVALLQRAVVDEASLVAIEAERDQHLVRTCGSSLREDEA